MLCSVAPRFRRPTTTRNCSISAARPASSGGREPAFGVYGFAIGSKVYGVIAGYKRSRYMWVEPRRSARGAYVPPAAGSPPGVGHRRHAELDRERDVVVGDRLALTEACDPVFDPPGVVVIVDRAGEHVDHLHDIWLVGHECEHLAFVA